MNTKHTFLSVVLSSVLAAGMAHAAEDPDDVGGRPDALRKDTSLLKGAVPTLQVSPDFTVQAKLPEVPAALPLYQVVPVDPARMDPGSDPVARAVGFSPDAKVLDRNADGSSSLMLSDREQRSIEYFSSGAVFFQNQSLFPEQGGDLLAEQKLDSRSAKGVYRERAEEFLKGNDLLRDGMVFKGVSFAQVKTQSAKGGEERTKVVGAAAHYGYVLDGIPAWGPGAKATVYFDQGGLSGYYNALRRLEPAKEADTLAPETALKAYMSDGRPRTLMRQHAGVVEQVVIEKVQLVYYMDAGNRQQDQVKPYYLISGTFLGSDAQHKGEQIRSEFKWLEPAVR